MADQRDHAFGANLRHYRVDARLTQDELAERAGLSVNAISALERGINQSPQQGTLGLLIDALGLPADDAALLRASARRQPAVPSPSRTTGVAGDPPGGLPRPLTSFIGREAELATVRGLLRGPDAVRLLTVTGPPGAGKTRLSLEAAATLRADYAGEVRFVPLAPIADPALVLPAIAQALGLQASGRSVDSVLASALRQRHLLLLLDNFEQVTAAAPAIGALLAACPRLHLLVTSRVRLDLYGEREYPLSSLALPPEAASADSAPSPGALERLAGTEAVRLFLARAQAARLDFALSPDNATDVASICRKLDGLPLAIELAAPRVKLLSPRALLARLDQRLALLTGGARDLPERQRTLRAAIAWSYDLLSSEEQALLRGLGVFVGGCTLDAVETVSPAAIKHNGTLDSVAALVDHSLVRQQEGRDGQPRCWMLETLLEFAREQLTAHGEEAEARHRHAAYYLALAEAAESGVQGPEIVTWLDRTETELENFRAASNWLVEQGEHDRALRLVGALWFSFVARGRILEGQGLLLPVVAATAGQRLPARAKALFGAGFFLITFDDHTGGRPLLLESLAIAEEAGDAALIGYALLGLGLSFKSDEDWTRVRECYARASACFESCDDWWGLGWAYQYAATPSFDANAAAWQPALLERALEIFLFHGNAHGAAETNRSLGIFAAVNEDFGAARDLLERSLTTNRQLGARLNVAWTLERLAGVALALGDVEAARRYMREALLLQRHMGNPAGIVQNLGTSAAIAFHDGHFERAATLAGAMTAHETPFSAPRRRAMLTRALRLESWQPQAQAVLGESAWAAAFVAGRRMPLDEAIAFAVADIWPAATERPGRTSATRR